MIMFRVGMGNCPAVPDSLSQEGKDFLSHCLVHDPNERWTAIQLQDHTFVKVGQHYSENLHHLYPREGLSVFLLVAGL